jgi:ABC-type transport system involved in cytochrome c biogenesis ATPase subunit
MNEALFEARALGLAYPGQSVLWQGLNFSLRPGLHWVQGGDGRGKSSLLRLIAGELQPTQGQVWRSAGTVCLEHAADPAHDAVVLRHWLQDRQARRADWQADLAHRLVDALDLTPHLDKPLYMLSTGSRRKAGWVATAASGAQLTLIDSPFAALDARSIRVLTDLLAEAAQDRRRAWVLADYAVPAALQPLTLASQIHLGD